MSINRKFLEEPYANIGWIFKSDLCTGCGTCSAICPKNCIELSINHSRGLIEPTIDQQYCNQCGLCIYVCPGVQLENSSIMVEHSGMEVVPNLGQVSAAFIGCSCDDYVRIQAASGGIVSEFLIYLLDKGLIDGAIVTRMNLEHPLEAETFIARNRDEILSAQKSKYCPVPACSILKEVLASKERFAFIGLPCHIAGLRKAQLQSQVLVERIPYVLGLFCSRTPNVHATHHLLYNMGIDQKEVQSIDYRGEGHPGRLRIKLKNGSEKFLEHLDYKYWGYTFLKYFKPIRCWLCQDHSAELADISFADDWTNLPPFKGDNKGSSTVVARTPDSARLLRCMKDEGRVVIYPISAQTVVHSQDLINKSFVSPRLWLWSKTGHVVPNLGQHQGLKPDPKNIIANIPEFVRIRVSRRYHSPSVMNVLIRCSWIIERVADRFRLARRRILKIPRLLISGFKAVSPIKGYKLRRLNKHKLVMIGGFGSHDIGDESMPHADILNLRARISNLEIVMCSPDPEYTLKFHGESSIRDVEGLSYSRNASVEIKFQVVVMTLLFLLGVLAERVGNHMRLWPTARSFLDETASADLLFNVGGGNLNSVIPTELYKKCTQYLAAGILKKPVIISGQTIGPFTRRIDSLYARVCLNTVHMITFRDKDISHERLKAIGVTKPIMMDAADDAITIPSIHKEIAGPLLYKNAPEDWIKKKTPLIAVMNLKGSLKIFKGEGRKAGLGTEIKLMVTIADKIIQKYNAKIFFLPTDYCLGVDDREIHREILSQMRFKSAAMCVEEEYDDVNLKGIISLADVAIGARYHFNVFAASSMVPFIGIASGIYQQTKLKGLAELCGLPECFVPEDMEFASIEEVWPRIERIIEDRARITDQLSKVIPLLKQKSTLGVETAITIMQTTDN
jgi:coenzyme F420 hydrogenase subunit beta